MGPVQKLEIPTVAALFAQGFPESISAFLSKDANPIPALTDIFMLLFQSVPGFFVARASGRVVGYVIAPAGIGTVWRSAVFDGHLLRWSWRFFRGRYGISGGRLARLVINKLSFVGSERRYSPPGRYGRILSIAVASDCRGQGISKLLLYRALEHLREQGMEFVKLEVRPDNIPAIRAYIGLGFNVCGEIKDVQGRWLVLASKL